MDNTNGSMLPIGTILNGKYHIQSHLSSGGFGNTYLAVYGSLKEKVAIKEFFMRTINQREGNGVSVSVSNGKGDTQLFNSQLGKFKKEAERLKQIKNVHVVKVHDLFEENGTAYYVMDFVEGYDLKDRLNRRGMPYNEKTIINYLRQILDGLSAIHSKKLLHLDIKPSNIMLTTHGYAKLIDLGASKDYIPGVGATFFSGLSLTSEYAPPEQMDGSYDKLGPWTDFYALGATIYKLLTFKDIPTFTTLYDDRSKDKHNALPMPHVSTEMKNLVVWMMQTDRTKRPQKVSDIVKFLDSMKRNESRTNDSIYNDSKRDVKKDDTIVIESPRLSVNKNILYFDAEENEDWQYVTVDTNQEWKVFRQAQWVEIEKFYSSFRVRVDENHEQGERGSLIKITAGNLVRTIDVVQKGKPMSHHLSSDNSRISSNAKKIEKEKDEEFSFLGCFYMIAIVVIIALIIKFIFLT